MDSSPTRVPFFWDLDLKPADLDLRPKDLRPKDLDLTHPELNLDLKPVDLDFDDFRITELGLGLGARELGLATMGLDYISVINCRPTTKPISIVCPSHSTQKQIIIVVIGFVL